MYRVYGIRIKGESDPKYIGATRIGISKRFSRHISDSLLDKVTTSDTSSRAIEKRDLFRQHHAGSVALEAYEIAAFESYKEMDEREMAEISAHKPPFNVAGVTKKAIGSGITMCLGEGTHFLKIPLTEEEWKEV